MALNPKVHWQWEGCKALRVTSAGVAINRPCVVYGFRSDAASNLQDNVGTDDATKTKVVNSAAGTQWFGLPGIRFEEGVRVTAVTSEAIIYYKD